MKKISEPNEAATKMKKISTSLSAIQIPLFVVLMPLSCFLFYKCVTALLFPADVNNAFIAILIIASVVVFGIFEITIRIQEAAKAVQAQQEKIQEEEEFSKTVSTFSEHFESKLRLMGERARVFIIEAEARAKLLNVIGIWLAVFSVFAPVVSICIHIFSDPLPQGLINTIQELRNADGNLPPQITLSVSRDWRVLLSGVSFGFLFLSAAGVIFGHYRRQMEMYFRLVKNVEYFEGLEVAAEVRRKANEEELPEKQEKLVDAVISELLKSPKETLPQEKSIDETEALANHIKEVIKMNSR